MSEIIELGDEVEDKITGFRGIVTARIEYIYDCLQFRVTPKCGKDGEQKKSDWVDEPQLKLLKKDAIKTKKNVKLEARTHGGVREHP